MGTPRLDNITGTLSIFILLHSMEEFLPFGAEEEPAPNTAGQKRKRSPSPVAIRAGSRAIIGTPVALPSGIAVPWQVSLTGAFKSLPTSCALLRLHEEVLDFAQFMSPTLSEQEYADEALTRITQAIQQLYPDARVEVFGSRANGLVLPTSDWDVVLFNVPSGSRTMHRIAVSAPSLTPPPSASTSSARAYPNTAVPTFAVGD
jgi:predicted nucleotidyltransferase